MKNIKIIEIERIDGLVVEHIIIDREDGSQLSMPKSVWDELEAAKEASGTLS